MSSQDKFYSEKESDAFFDRWQQSELSSFKNEIRPTKKEILETLKNNLELNSLKVLEVGCFISDLLSVLKKDWACEVHGIESSSKACKYAKEKYDLDIENSTFLNSKYYNLSKENNSKFDLIICDDVLSWMSRDKILTSLGVLDWILKPGGYIYLRDFSPNFGFAYKNHHWPKEEIYNFKQPGGHRKFFLDTGSYVEILTNLRVTSSMQKVTTNRPDSMIWADTIIKKLDVFLHPIRNQGS